MARRRVNERLSLRIVAQLRCIEQILMLRMLEHESVHDVAAIIAQPGEIVEEPFGVEGYSHAGLAFSLEGKCIDAHLLHH